MGTWNTARLHLSSMTHGVDWPWSGSVRKIIYVDFFIYLVLLVLFCCITLLPTANTSFDAYKLVQSVQSTLLEEVCLCIAPPQASARCVARARDRNSRFPVRIRHEHEIRWLLHGMLEGPDDLTEASYML